MDLSPLLSYWPALCAAALLILFALGNPIKRMLGFLLRTAGGFLFLTVLGQTGLSLGLGANLFNAVTLALLGIPGFGLLLMLNWACVL